MAKPTGLSDEVRTIFEARKRQSLGHQEVFELMEVTGADKTKERNGVRDVLTWLVSCGYLVKTGARATAAYRYSGQGMRFHKATAEELRERRIERGRAYRARNGGQPKAPRVDKMTINRSRVALLADLAPAKPWGKEKDSQRPAETVEQFEARGGKVQRLTASWEQAA
ncbi:hypothetical protein B9Y60_14595 [Stenotrophomonas maltophilia]|uniref:hypothetical protein n=1 Tax=Stenotrophomonas maltophilia TaxID=40324 RepID=UPI000C258611|nr:hypothetical protein [Stenotrophomonas maltophilia]PJL51013.1 hypothetical protein B9Y73_14595 [Stenotrophomonas maltophilia]PJL54589.1 hypothetical protein B9Y60_14595 [Stenotrophomonas maltophilia]